MSDSGGNGNAAAGDAAAAAGNANAGAGNDGAANNNAGGGNNGNNSSASVAFALPEAYKDAAWAKDFKSHDDVFKSLANAQQFIGRKGFGVPGEKATDAERAEFFKELGVPDNADGYEFKRPDGVDESMWNTEHEKKWAGLMKQHNVPKAVANALRDEMLKETLEGHNNGIKLLNEALDKTFGDKKTEVAKQVGDLMTKAIPDAALRQQIQDGIGNKNTPAFALALGHVMQYMQKTYGLSDTNVGDGGDGTGGKSIAEMRAEATKLMSSDAYRDPMHKDHTATRKQVDGMYADIGRLTDAAKKK